MQLLVHIEVIFSVYQTTSAHAHKHTHACSSIINVEFVGNLLFTIENVRCRLWKSDDKKQEQWKPWKKDFMNYKLVNLNQFRWVLYTQNMKVFSPFGWLIIYFYWCNTLELEFNALNVAFVLRKLKHFAAKNKSDTMKNDIRSLRNQFRFETHHKMCTNTPTLCKCSNKAITILVCLCVCEMKIEYAAVATELTACNFRIGAGNMYY